MSIAVAHLRPAVHLPVNAHRDAITIDATETGVPALYTIKPDTPGRVNAIQHLPLAAMAKKGVKRVSNDCHASLLMDEVYTTLHAQVRSDRVLDEKCQQVTLIRANLFAHYEVEAIVASGPQITGAQSPVYHIMIGDCNHIQARIVLDMMENLLNRPYTITVGTMHMQVGLAKLPRMKRLPLGHLPMFLQSSSSYFLQLLQLSILY